MTEGTKLTAGARYCPPKLMASGDAEAECSTVSLPVRWPGPLGGEENADGAGVFRAVVVAFTAQVPPSARVKSGV